ncbi:C-GCAxxG-C-C family (seleno)protein [Deferribacterales bacterium RsTz2092]|nr:hypothetical protein AGMMS49941_08560 [Deferribacterales bacterium]
MFIANAGELSGDNYRKKLNCSESVLQAFDELCKLGVGSGVRLATGFGGGIGHSNDICGALSASIMVLGALKGRIEPQDGDLSEIYKLSKGFHNCFKTQFNGTTCDVIRKHEFGTREQRLNCLDVITKTGELLAKYLSDNALTRIG